MDLIATLGLAFGSAWVSGINLYALVATLGLLGRFTGYELPGDMQVLANEWVIGTAVALYCVEFVADKVPYVDSAWDVVHTFVRVPAGAVLAWAAFSGGGFSPVVQVVALLLGGGLALSSHGAKAATRAAINLSPEPATNITASIAEDVLAIGSTLLAVFAPLAMLVVIAVALVVTVWLLPKLIRLLRKTIASARALFKRRPAVG
jgi:hypothetical protein